MDNWCDEQSPRQAEVDNRKDISADDLLKAIPEYNGLIVRGRTKVTASVLDAAIRLKAIGRAGVGVDTIDVDAADSMRFTPSNVSVKKGETIRFVIKNSGKVPHEFSLGTEKELKEHYEVMKKFPTMEHEEANKISLKPGKQGEVIWRFTKPGVVNFACLHVGHYEAGMKGQVKVAAK